MTNVPCENPDAPWIDENKMENDMREVVSKGVGLVGDMKRGIVLVRSRDYNNLIVEKRLTLNSSYLPEGNEANEVVQDYTSINAYDVDEKLWVNFLTRNVQDITVGL